MGGSPVELMKKLPVAVPTNVMDTGAAASAFKFWMACSSSFAPNISRRLGIFTFLMDGNAAQLLDLSGQVFDDDLLVLDQPVLFADANILRCDDLILRPDAGGLGRNGRVLLGDGLVLTGDQVSVPVDLFHQCANPTLEVISIFVPSFAQVMCSLGFVKRYPPADPRRLVKVLIHKEMMV
jgi:hypothetical protein